MEYHWVGKSILKEQWELYLIKPASFKFKVVFFFFNI